MANILLDSSSEGVRMEPATWGFIGALVGTLIGASASIATTAITARNSRLLQQGASSLDRSERAREFQRNNLLELQDSLFSSMRLTGRAHLEDEEFFRKNDNEGGRSMLSEELSQELMMSNRKLAILTERIADQSLRESVQILRTGMTNVLLARTEDTSFGAFQSTTEIFEKVMKDLGVVLRSSY